MAKVKVAVVGTIGKSITFDPDATVGAQIGINLALPDGTIPSLAELAAAIVAAGDDVIVSAITTGVGSETILETQIADGAILARVGSAESITQPWTFEGTITLADNALLRILDVSDASLSSTTHPFQIGLTSGPNLIMDQNEIMARDNGVAAILSINILGGDINLGSTVRISGAAGVTGETSTGTIEDHGGVDRDIGFNLLPVFNDNQSDVLEANHCGHVNVKRNTTGRTLTAEASGSTDFPVGGVTHMLNWGTSANYAFTEGSGTTIFIITPGTGAVDSDGGFSLQPGGFCTIWRYSATEYYCWGAELN